MIVSPLRKYQNLLLIVGLIFIWPTALNKTPFLFWDTTAYLRAADGLVYKVSGKSTLWTASGSQEQTPDNDTNAESDSTESISSSSSEKNILLGRSIYYGLLIYPAALFDNLFIPALIQCLLCGVAIVGVVRHVVDPGRQATRFVGATLTVVAVTALTALPYFASFLMPDVFTGLAIVAAAVILCRWPNERPGWKLFWLALLTLCALTHSSHILILFGLAVFTAGAAYALRQVVPWKPIALVLGIGAIGLMGEMGFSIAVEKMLHVKTIRPPFMAARLIADGPGAAFLKTECPRSTFIYCRFRNVDGLTSDQLLWLPDPNRGIFTAQSAETQRIVAREEKRFLLSVLAKYPFWTAGTMITNFGRQLGKIHLTEFNGPLIPDTWANSRLPASVAASTTGLTVRQNHASVAIYAMLNGLVCLIALAVLAVIFFDRTNAKARLPILTIVAAIAMNAAICGILSTPHDRYQDRVIWLLPVAATLALLGRPRKNRSERPMSFAVA